jgi:hypothetical protein
MELKDICVGRKYTDKDGQEKTKWTTIGTGFVKDGKMSIKLELIPTNWDGSCVVFDRKPKEQAQQPAQQVQQPQTDGVPF